MPEEIKRPYFRSEAERLRYYSGFLENAAAEAAQNGESWIKLLSGMARFYKYPFHDQLMILAQRPDATACAEYDVWNNQVGRYVKKGSKGIALLDVGEDETRIRYVFDISDTGTRRNSRPVNLWQMREEYLPAVKEMLEGAYAVPAEMGLEAQIDEIARESANSIWFEQGERIADILAVFLPAEYDTDRIERLFKGLTANSAACCLLSRCSIKPRQFFSPEDFRSLSLVNDYRFIMTIGSAVSDITETVFRSVERAIRGCEQNRQTERSTDHERNDLHDEWRLPVPEPDREADREEAAGQVRQDAPSVSEAASADLLRASDYDREPVSAPSGDRRDGEPQAGADDERPSEAEPRPGQGEGSDGVGPAYEHAEGASGGSDLRGADLQVEAQAEEIAETAEDFAAFFPELPSESAQISFLDALTPISFDTAGRNEPRPAFSVSMPQETIDHILRMTGNMDNGRLEIATEFSKGKDIEALADYLQESFHGGNGVLTPQGRYSAWYAEDGIHIAGGNSARYAISAVTLSWEDAAKRIGQMLEDGQFATNVELAEMSGHERLMIAQSLWYMQRDLSEEADTAGHLSIIKDFHGGFPDETKAIAERLANPDFLNAAIEQMDALRSAYAQDRSVLRFHYHKPEELLTWLMELEIPRIEYTSDMMEVPQAVSFITEDEIAETLAHGSSIEGGKGRIYRYFTDERHTVQEQAAFLKNEYGIGGRSHAVSRSTNSGESHDSKGIVLNKANCPAVQLDWSNVAKRIATLILQDRFLTNAEKEKLAALQAEKVLAEVETPVVTDPAPEEDNLIEETPALEETAETDSLPYSVGDTLYLEDGKPFVVEKIGILNVSLRDDSLLYPILRSESKENLARLLEQYPQEQYRHDDEREAIASDAPAPEPVPVAIYPAEENNLPFDIVIERISMSEPDPPAVNFRITDDDLGTGSAKTKFRRNIEAIQLLKMLERDDRPATPQEQEILSQYVGWGGLADAFDSSKQSWETEYNELIAVLTPDEYAAARASTLNAHYTSPVVIRAMYQAIERMGFTSGNILEPSMGIGNFFGMLPESMSASRLYGVELDSITGRIAQKLYPNADITVAGFETTDRRDFYDLAVGNVPFGNYKVNDRAYNKLNFTIHNYFFAKALDQVRPGGVVAFVTSRYTMDAKDSTVRRYLAQRAELLGAIRLPENAFSANAGTEVVSDIIFLQKREHLIDIEPDWVHLGETPEGFAVNSYFTEHPNMVLGDYSAESTMYGGESFTVRPREGVSLAEQLSEAITHIEGTYREVEIADIDPDTFTNSDPMETIPADPNVRNFSYAELNGDVYYRENSVMRRMDVSDTRKERLLGMIRIRDIVHKLMDEQLAGADDNTISAIQQELNAAYDAFFEKFGLINSKANQQVFAEDSAYYLLCSLENIDEDGNLKSKADIFTQRTILPEHSISSVDTPSEALTVSISERGRVDLPYMAELLGCESDDYDDIIASLKGAIYLDPVSGEWETAESYLSGNVRDKLRIAKLKAASEPAYAENVEALEKALPRDLEPSEIDVRLGATWIDPMYYQQFLYELLDTPYYQRRNISVRYSDVTAEWSITGKSRTSYNDVQANITYGTGRMNAYKILEETLNLKDVRVYDSYEDADGKKVRVLNKKETTLAQQKQQAIKDAFRDWIWRDPNRRETLCRRYNDLFNAIRPREYDGSHIHFVGMNPEITLREHQRNAIAHILYGGNTLLAHEVGAGKSFEMAAAAMESKRLGLCSKSMFVVPNHLTLQWAHEFLTLYPAAKLLVAGRKDFEKANRKKFCARIATGDYDAIIIGHSQFERIPISYERQERLLRDQLEELEAAIHDMKEANGEQFTIKQMEKTRKTIEARLQKLIDEGRKDDVVTFEQLGVDRLFVDESQAFKNLFLFSKMRNVAGLSTSESQRSADMFLKCRYMDELTGGRGVIFASGTPVSNSMVELYTVMRYLQYGTLQRLNLTHFDCWASTFGETTTSIELAPEGTGYRARTRFAKFFNLPELMSIFKEAADIKTGDQLHLPVPEAHFETVVVQPSDIQKEMVAALSERAAAIHNKLVDPSVDNMLLVTSDGRKIGLDQRLMNPLLPDDPNSKLNACVRNVLRLWEEGATQKLTQLLFCDLSTPKNDGTFNVYTDIRDKLISAGVSAEEIAFIHDADTEAKKKELFAKVRTGSVRVLIGSTQKMGAGTNVQDRLIAVHHLDVGWRPSDMTQRNGRIIRQGNMNPEVYVFQYVTEGTFDAYLYQTLENKQRFISQIMTSKSPVRSCDDVDEQVLSYAEVKALCAGNPAIKEKMDLDIEVARLKVLKADHQSQQYRLEDRLLKEFPAAIERQKSSIEGFRKDAEIAAAHPQIKDDFCGMDVFGRHYSDKKEAGEALLNLCKACPADGTLMAGTYRGFEMHLSYDTFTNEVKVNLKGGMAHYVSLGTDARGNIQRMDNAIASIPLQISDAEEKLKTLYHQQESAQAELGKPFPQEDELKQKSARLAELDALLNMDDAPSSDDQAGERGDGDEKSEAEPVQKAETFRSRFSRYRDSDEWER